MNLCTLGLFVKYVDDPNHPIPIIVSPECNYHDVVTDRIKKAVKEIENSSKSTVTFSTNFIAAVPYSINNNRKGLKLKSIFAFKENDVTTSKLVKGYTAEAVSNDAKKMVEKLFALYSSYLAKRCIT